MKIDEIAKTILPDMVETDDICTCILKFHFRRMRRINTYWNA